MLNIIQPYNSKFSYIAKASLLAIVLTYINGYVLMHGFIGDELMNVTNVPVKEISFFSILGLVIFSPIVETCLVFICFSILNLIPIINSSVRAIICTLAMSFLHHLTIDYWGFFVVPVFYIMSASYQHWAVSSVDDALEVCLIIHALYNLSILVIIFISDFVLN
ncbi:hypothetical protein AB4427_17650 [Vibrio artabrorum]|uniref:hypothetical protein n=1 Tax=Vibrio artabrorum TaxID=446374 RepID=UPI003550DDA4